MENFLKESTVTDISSYLLLKYSCLHDNISQIKHNNTICIQEKIIAVNDGSLGRTVREQTTVT